VPSSRRGSFCEALADGYVAGAQAAGADLRTWAHAQAARRGRRIAVVALARRLSRILYAMWRDHTDFEVRPRRSAAAA